MIINFGEVVNGYERKVFNEREIRAGAGILFLFALISFMNSWLVGDFTFTKIFVVGFMIDFFIRLFISPRFSPSLIIGRFFVNNKIPEYVNAEPKKWAWSLAFILAVIMFYMVVLNDIKGPANLFICLSCLTLLFFEGVFGVCIGCKIYSLFHRDECPDGECDISDRSEVQKVSITQWGISAIFVAFVILMLNIDMPSLKSFMSEKDRLTQEEKDCVVPQFAIDMGHIEKWKLHNGCK